jgi:hypothetical protein
LLNFIAAQVNNIVTAAVWFAYWPEGNQPILPWVLMGADGLCGLFAGHSSGTRATDTA